jgi:hypothetical protein
LNQYEMESSRVVNLRIGGSRDLSFHIVCEHTNRTLDLCEVAAEDDGRRVVVDVDLEPACPMNRFRFVSVGRSMSRARRQRSYSAWLSAMKARPEW